jgi:peptidoglycan LD-endopeptidase LytH
MKRRSIAFLVPGVIVAVCLAVAVVKAGPLGRHPFVAARLAGMRPSPVLPVPVVGVRPRDLRDTWNGPRSGGRRHRGIDIFAKRDTPVRSATAGIIATVGNNRLGGRIVRVFGPGGEWHYYAHLERFGPITPGQVVTPGTILGYVGDSGNAKGTPPHLHYGIYRALGGAMNPYVRLATRGATSRSLARSARRPHR